jgi:hypothetical protein
MSPAESCLRCRVRGLTAWTVLAVLLFSLPALGASRDSRDIDILGWVERVRLVDPEVNLKAKLDTGADTSSLDVEIVKKFRKGDKRYVRFDLIDRVTGEKHTIVRERIRTASIVMHDAERQSRPVVRMRICIAGHILDTEVTLIDRSEFTYPLLLGRKALESFALIDPGNTYLSKPECEPTPGEGSAEN